MNDDRPSGLRPDAIPDDQQFAGPIVVGVGASGGHGGALERFLSRLVMSPDQAVVLVIEHREALDEKSLSRALAGSDGAKLSPIADGAPVEGGKIYLGAPDVITTLQAGAFHLRPAEPSGNERGAIDSFLASLAEDRAEEAIAVALAGTGSDGTLGVSAIKELGGLSIVERGAEDTAHHLSHSNQPAALADFVLPLDDIADHIKAYVGHLRRVEERKGYEVVLAEVAVHLDAIAEILRARTGNDFHGYKRNTFLRRVQRRMQVVRIDDISRYLDHLRAEPDEVLQLFNDLLIGVTQFFRDEREYEVLRSDVVPKMFAGKAASDQVRVWVLGCATGEEAYSIAILLREHMQGLQAPPNVQIFATDIDGRALATARAGRFRDAIAKDMSPERLTRWFVKESDTYCIVKELREMCIFSQHNVIKDAPFSKLDLVSCRNLLIYLNAELQDRVIPLFHFALRPDRFLFLGTSENVTRHAKLFVAIDRRARIFKKIDGGKRLLLGFPITTVTGRPVLDVPRPPRVAIADHGLERRAQRIAARHAPAYVVADNHFHVLQFSGRMGRYLDPTAGAATLELMSLVHRDLRLELGAALDRAAAADKTADAEPVDLAIDGRRIVVDMTVEPVREAPSSPRNFVIVFKDHAGWPDAAVGNDDADLVRGEHVDRLEGELRSTREKLQATIEELESTNEELKSSNEEYQSLNEELQSANEELETSREELQSVNEELTTVNGELAHRVHELTRATSDLKNFLESTQIATVFLDNQLRIMNYTPAIAEVLHIVETDIGRPIGHIKSKIAIEDVFNDIRQVLRTLTPIEHEVVAPDSGIRYMVRILPYRSTENFIAGVVVNFLDVTAITKAEARQSLLLAELQHRVRNMLGVVRSIARRSAESSETVADFARNLDGRLNAFARTQVLASRDPEAGVDLEYLVVEELAAFRAKDSDLVRIAGPAVLLQSKAAESIALAIHELATNAAKHGALSRPGGSVAVNWDVGQDGATPRLLIDWREQGGPRLAKPPKRRGFGTELLERTLAFELKAETRLDFEPTGLRCTIALPLSERLLKAN